jgi:N-acetyl-anhydromuramyl-L-alanine amidase AmpD/N-acetylmuramoyl-L-alanine amidase
MKTSLFEKLRQPTTIVLSAGHGDGDPGAVNGDFKEADEAIIMVDEIAKQLKKEGITVDVVPHENGLERAIKYVNARYDEGDAWAIEIHRGSADGLLVEQASLRCVVYYYPSQGSTEIGIFIANALKRFGAHGTSWARPDTESRFKRLPWIQETKPVAHLLELGFMEGDNSKKHLLKLAKIAAQSLYEAFTGVAWDDESTEMPAPETAPAPPGKTRRHSRVGHPGGRGARRHDARARETPAAPAVPMVVVTSASTLLDQLVSAYKGKDLAALFKKLKANVHPEDFDDLQNASLAQWILESGWAKSGRARDHFNFGGLKWRPEMANWTEAKDGVLVQPVKYTAWDGPGTYCKFASPSAYINGYWRFLMRSPYHGWEEHASNPKDYISYLLKCGYTESPTYLNEVMSLLPKAIALLAGASAHPETAPAGGWPATLTITAAPKSSPGPGAANAPRVKGSVGKVDADHWLSSAKREHIDGGNPLTPLYVVIHYTEGFSAESSVSGWKHRDDGILAHVVVDRDGTISQCRPFNRTCMHAGGPGLAIWQDPRTGKTYNGANSVSIGIEIANTGMNTDLHKKLGKPGCPAGTTVAASHRNGSKGSNEARDGKVWEVYPKAQLQAVFDMVSLLMAKYDLHDITGHDCISSWRKADPGPAFPTLELRKANGLSGLPVVCDSNGKPIPV